jgi:hypothetical protein
VKLPEPVINICEPPAATELQKYNPILNII